MKLENWIAKLIKTELEFAVGTKIEEESYKSKCKMLGIIIADKVNNIR